MLANSGSIFMEMMQPGPLGMQQLKPAMAVRPGAHDEQPRQAHTKHDHNRPDQNLVQLAQQQAFDSKNQEA